AGDAGPRLANRACREHAAGPAAPGHPGPGRGRAGCAGQGRVLQPGRLGEGPDRAAHGRGGRKVGTAPPRRDAHRAAPRPPQPRPGGPIIEPASGNTGVGLAIVAVEKGYRCLFVCPDKVGQDKISVLRAYGAEVVVCPGAVPPEHPESYYSVSTRLARETPGGWKPDQYANPQNPASHYHSTGPEVWAQTEGKATHFVAGIGTGGPISAPRPHPHDL